MLPPPRAAGRGVRDRLVARHGRGRHRSRRRGSGRPGAVEPGGERAARAACRRLGADRRAPGPTRGRRRWAGRRARRRAPGLRAILSPLALRGKPAGRNGPRPGDRRRACPGDGWIGRRPEPAREDPFLDPPTRGAARSARRQGARGNNFSTLERRARDPGRRRVQAAGEGSAGQYNTEQHRAAGRPGPSGSEP